MILVYGGYSLSFAIGGSASGAAFLAPTDGSALGDGRTGQVQACRWISGSQNTASYIEITVTVASPLDATAAIGGVGVCNIIGLPAGTKVVVGGITQRLVACAPRGELSAWFLPQTTGNSFPVRVYNDVNGVASIAASHEFAIGEIYAGRAMNLRSRMGAPTDDLQDPTAFARTAGGSLWQLMRKPFRQAQHALGLFSFNDAKGGPSSTLSSGANPAGVIDIQTLRGILSKTNVCAICDVAHDRNPVPAAINGLRYDQDFMQGNWMLCRPSAIGTLALDQRPFWSWTLQMQEAT